MRKGKKVYKGILYLIVSQCIVKVFGLVYKLYLANKEGFGDSGNAIYNSGYQIYALLLTISSIGVPNAISKLVSEKYNSGNRAEVQKLFKSAVVVFFFIGTVLSIVLGISAGFVSDKLLNIKEAKYSIIALSPAILNVCLISVYRGIYNGTENIEVTAKSQTVEQLLKTVFTIIFVEIGFIITKSNTVIMAACANLATTAATLCSLQYLNKKNKYCINGIKYEKKYIKKILSISMPISLSAILASFNKNIDSMTVVRFLKNTIGENNAKLQYGLLSGKVDVLAALPISFIVAIATTVIPTISALASQNDMKSIRFVTGRYLLYTILIALPCTLGIVAFSDQIMTILFKSNEGSFLLKISAISILFVSVEQIVNATLQGIGKVYIPALALLVGVVAKIILNIVLIKIPECSCIFGGISGACASTVACHVIASQIGWAILRKKIKIKLKFTKYVLKPIISSCIMLVSLSYSYSALKCIISEKIAIILAIMIAGILYISSLFLLRIFSKKEVEMLPFISIFFKK